MPVIYFDHLYFPAVGYLQNRTLKFNHFQFKLLLKHTLTQAKAERQQTDAAEVL